MLTAAGLAASVGGQIYGGIQANRAAKASAAQVATQRDTEAQLTAIRDQRTREEYRRGIRQQAAELASRGVSLDSPTAVLLGQFAGQELSFASQSVRSEGQATQIELSASEQALRARGRQSLLRGYTSAAGSVLTAAPEVWPGLLS